MTSPDGKSAISVYVGVGNRMIGPLTSDTMTYNAGNEQLSVNTAVYEYDLNGNRIKKTESGVITNYTYDDENRLIFSQQNANKDCGGSCGDLNILVQAASLNQQEK